MFTGIIEEMGKVAEIRKQSMAMELAICARKVLEGTKIGDSIAVNGVCLTVTSFNDSSFTVDVMPETMKRTNLGSLRVGSMVNLERALAVGSRLGGHFVQGHVDGEATVIEKIQHENAVLFRFRVSPEHTRYMVEKGSIAINGISLTLVDVGQDWFSVSIIPHTLRETTLQFAQIGDRVNIECDLIGKYVAKLLDNRSFPSLTMEKLRETGFLADKGGNDVVSFD